MTRAANSALFAHGLGSDARAREAEAPSAGNDILLRVVRDEAVLPDQLEDDQRRPLQPQPENDQTPDTAALLPDGERTLSAVPDLFGPDASATAWADPEGEHELPRQHFRRWSGRYIRETAALDALVALFGMLVTGAVATSLSLGQEPTAAWFLGSALVWPTVITLVRGYERSRVGIGGDEMRALLRAALLVVSVSAVPAGLFGWQDLLTAVVVTAPVAVIGSLAVRFATRKRLHRQQRQGRCVRKVVVVGSVAAAADLSRILSQEQHCGMNVVGVCVPGTEVHEARTRGLEVVGDLEQVASAIREFDCDAVAVTSGDATRHNYLRELSWSLEGTDVELLVHPGLIEVAGPRMHIRPFVGLPLLYVEQPHFTGWRRLVKRATDVSLAGVGVLLLSPLLAAIATAIKLQDGGPVIFRQTRIGTAGSSFTMLKFRSMVIDAESRKAALLLHNEGAGPLFKIRQDPRITRLGRFLRDYSLDELPQLFNVLGGSMSLVGPRPQLESEVELLPTDARRRLLVTPGVTGLWQVSGRSGLSWEESVRLDLRYVENWSLTLDLHIMWRTVHAVISRKGSS
jgi:exopolysaccharide biosynthesis polyprenyl glycosylphosphotransferase